MENMDEVQINLEFPDKVTFIGAHLVSPLREELIANLREHRDCFAGSYDELHPNKIEMKRVRSRVRHHHQRKRTKTIGDRVNQGSTLFWLTSKRTGGQEKEREKLDVHRLHRYLVDATTGHDMMNLLDASSRYNQILMHPEDQEKSTFMTARGIYSYQLMPFGLKNANSTYQHLVNEMFVDLIGRTMEVYIDDMIMKSKQTQDHISHPRQTFTLL